MILATFRNLEKLGVTTYRVLEKGFVGADACIGNAI